MVKKMTKLEPGTKEYYQSLSIASLMKEKDGLLTNLLNLLEVMKDVSNAFNDINNTIKVNTNNTNSVMNNDNNYKTIDPFGLVGSSDNSPYIQGSTPLTSTMEPEPIINDSIVDTLQEELNNKLAKVGLNKDEKDN